MSVQPQIDRLVTQRASEWFEAFRAGAPVDAAEFVRWVSETPRHMAELLAIVALNEELPAALARTGVDRDELLKQVSGRTAAPTVTQLVSGTASMTPAVRRKTGHLVWAAGLATLALGATLWLGPGKASEEYVTQVGEQRTVALSDGSVMHLDARTSTQVAFDGTLREIHLLEGAALFQVAPDRQRPFTVRTRNAVVQAIGTRFNVDARRKATVVSVLEGKVAVQSRGTGAASSLPLAAGQAAEISSEGRLTKQAEADVAGAVAWQQRKLVFSKTPLEDAVADFNRFGVNGQIVLMDVEPGSHHYTGTFDADDLGSFAELLSREKDLVVESQPGRYLVRRASGYSDP